MEQSTAQRRLVKSRPELWAEVSSETSLGRHFAEFGEIRITRVEPETTVAWEGDRASGTVELAPAGWGTKVTLTATPSAAAEPASEPPPPAAEQATVVPEPPPASEQDRVATQPPPAPWPATPPPERRGFLARLFRRRPRRKDPALEIPGGPGPPLPDPVPPAPAPDPSPPAPGPDPTPPDPGPAPTPPPPVPDPVPPSPDPVPGPTPGPDPMPPTIHAPALDAQRTVAILTEVLDDLGTAHRQPFTRD